MSVAGVSMPRPLVKYRATRIVGCQAVRKDYWCVFEAFSCNAILEGQCGRGSGLRI